MTTTTESTSTTAIRAPAAVVHRVEVWYRPALRDPTGEAALAHICSAQNKPGGDLVSVRTARVYLIEAPLDAAILGNIAQELLTDPVVQIYKVGFEPVALGVASVEVHCKPGVMDPVAQSTREAVSRVVEDLGQDEIQVRTGTRYDLTPQQGVTISGTDAGLLAEQSLANTVIHDIHTQPYHPKRFPAAAAYRFELRRVPLRGLDDDALTTLSRAAHLFLSLEEMHTVRDHYQTLGREPTDIELETIAQTWSEHCVHKTLKATIRYRQPDGGVASPSPHDWADRPGHELDADGSITIRNLLKSTIAAATHQLMAREEGEGWCVSVFEDNAGIVRFDDTDAVCIKVETHNHPSAIEPYGGAATGIGGCIRDIMGTGLAARPVANMDTFCVGFPKGLGRGQDRSPDLKGVIPPARTLERVVAGVRDYGNRMGIPTVNGAVWFHRDYTANPLVFAGCVGLIPLDRCFGDAEDGDRIVVLGGRTGRDGVHGATFSSAELTDTHAEEFGHAVQIGNAITQKKTLDVILQARDHPSGCLFTAITDCGAGGFSSAVGEMAEKRGADVTLDNAPLKYDGLSYTEIWISEAQERMVLAVPPNNLDVLQRLCDAEGVELADLGRFGQSNQDGNPELVLNYKDSEVGRLPMRFLHDGLPDTTREACWRPPGAGASLRNTPRKASALKSIDQVIYSLLGHPNIASKHWVVRQYDHEVQGGSAVKPLVGPEQDGPSDAAVIRPKLDSKRGIAIACGLSTGLGEKSGGDSYWMALAAIDEAVRNCVCVGAAPDRIAILDNFCWPNCDDPAQLGSLVRAAQACYDGAMAYATPFVSGKDSLSNQFTAESGELITIPPTLLISALGIVHDTTRCVTMDAKREGDTLLLVGPHASNRLGGSHYLMAADDPAADIAIPHTDLDLGPRTAAAVAVLIDQRVVAAAHDCSDGGLLVAAAEMAFAGHVGLNLDLISYITEHRLTPAAACFSEAPSRYLLEITSGGIEQAEALLKEAGIPSHRIGRFTPHARLTLRLTDNTAHTELDESLDDLRAAWLKPLDW